LRLLCGNKGIRDQIVEGLVDCDIVESLLREKNLTRAQEAARKQRAEITSGALGDSVSHAYVQALHRQHMPPSPPKACQGCGLSVYSGGRQQCPAINRKCNHCRKVGHLAKVCRAKKYSPRLPSYAALSLQPDMI
jgi:hypothetical protein